MVDRTQVAIIGAGPAGLILGRLLELAGIEATILEIRDRPYVEQRVRAGMLEHGTVELLSDLGVGERLRREGFRHDSFEVRSRGQPRQIPMAELTGRTAWVYGQQEVVKDLIAARTATGSPLLFEVSDIRLDGLETAQPTVHYRHDGVERTLRCDAVAGCDGFHGISRPSIPAEVLTTYSWEYPFAWFGVLADAPPVTTERLIYAHHPRGFALHSFRSREVSRLYLQARPDEDIDAWSDAAIWEELQTRFATDDGAAVNEGPIKQRNLTPMRSFVTEPMQYGNLFLAGDAAHIVPPTAAKGLNLAVADVCVLADALVAFLRNGSRDLLDRYSETALRRVWRVQEFSRSMTAMFHHEPGDTFGAQLQGSRLDVLCTSPAAMASFCAEYVGLPIESGLLGDIGPR